MIDSLSEILFNKREKHKHFSSLSIYIESFYPKKSCKSPKHVKFDLIKFHRSIFLMFSTFDTSFDVWFERAEFQVFKSCCMVPFFHGISLHWTVDSRAQQYAVSIYNRFCHTFNFWIIYQYTIMFAGPTHSSINLQSAYSIEFDLFICKMTAEKL